MPGLVASGASGKRKRVPSETRPKKRARSESEDDEQSSEAHIARLEMDIFEKKKYEHIAALIKLVQNESEEIAIAAAFSSCKIFAKLMATGELSNKPGDSEEGLRKQYSAYKRQLLVRDTISA
jgi:U3 small nucleolar RNA-associated protein 19